MSGTDLRVRLTDLRRHPGDRLVVAGPVDIDGLAVTTAAVAGSTGDVDLVIESLSDGVTVTGTVGFRWIGSCRRCLDETSGSGSADISEVFKDHPDDEQLLAIAGDTVDLTPVIREAVLLALPLAPLCRDDCAGPDPDHFPVTTADDDGEAPTDPRWAALAELEFDTDRTESES